jgi:hypothetical protein
MNIIVYICPNNEGHYYAAPGFTPDNPDITKVQTHNTPDGPHDGPPRVNCPYCRTVGAGEVARVPHRITGMARMMS